MQRIQLFAIVTAVTLIAVGIPRTSDAQILYSGDSLNSSNYISSNGQYRLAFACSDFTHCILLQDEWNGSSWQLRGYIFFGTTAAFKAPFRLTMQTDGNLVYYDKFDVAVDASNTVGSYGAYLWIQDDGNVVIYDTGNNPIWTPYCEYPSQQFYDLYPFDGTCP